jgi:general secretion pathway protein L
MSGHLLIRLDADGTIRDWLVEDERGRVLAGPSAGDPSRATLAGADRVTLLIPAESASLLEAQVPARSRDQLLRALPFAVEDALAEPVETLHFAAVGEPGGTQRVAVVRRERMRAWTGALAARGIRADTIAVDAAVVPLDDGAAAAVFDGERALLRLDAAHAMACDAGEIPMWLGSAASVPRDAGGRPRLRAWGDPAPRELAGAVALEAGEPEPALRVLARGLRRGGFADLARGEFAPSHRGEPVRRLWRVAGMLAAGFALLVFAQALFDRLQLSRRVEAARSAMQDVYRNVYPGSPLHPDPAARMRGEYQQLRPGESGPLGMLGKVAPIVTQNPAHQVESIEYRNGQLELAVRAPGVAALDALRESAATVPGLSVELASATADERGAQGTLRVRERAP